MWGLRSANPTQPNPPQPSSNRNQPHTSVGCVTGTPTHRRAGLATVSLPAPSACPLPHVWMPGLSATLQKPHPPCAP